MVSQYDQDHQVLEYLATLSYRAGDLGSYLHRIATGVSRLLGSDWSIVTVCQDVSGQVVASSHGLREGDNEFSVHSTLVGEVIQSGRSLIIPDIRLETAERSRLPEEYLCYLGVPLRTATGQCIGTICSFLRQPRQFTAEEVRTAELFAERAATAIDNYRLYQQQQKFNELLELEIAARTAELRATQVKLVEQERLAAIGQFAAMIAHEVRNPLTTMIMGLNYAKNALSSDAAQERLSLSLSEANRLERLLNEILLYAKPQVLQLSKLAVNRFIRSLLVQMSEMPEAAGRQIKLTNTLPEIEILGDQDKLKQVFINIFRNACEAIAAGDVVSCEITSCAPSERVCISVHNGGDSIPPAILPKLTEPFCSTKSSGAGLGLAIVKRIVEAHGGELCIQSASTTGTTVSVQLPITSL